MARLDWGEIPGIIGVVIGSKAREKADVNRVPSTNHAVGPRWVALCDMGGSSYGIDAEWACHCGARFSCQLLAGFRFWREAGMPPRVSCKTR